MRYHRPTELIGNKEIKLIHVAASKLGLPRDAYEAILLGAAGVDTSKRLTFKGYEAVMRRFKELGFKLFYKSPSPSVPSPQGRGNYPPPPRGEGQDGGAKMRPFREPVRGKDRVPGPGRTLGDYATADKQAKIYALWEDVARVKTPKALRAFIHNRLRIRVDSIAWLTEYEANKVIEALKAMQEREITKKEPPAYDGPLSGYREE